MPTTPDRPADQLHAAAAKLRAVSSAATDGPWTIANIPPYTDPVLMSRYEETPADGEVLIVGNVDVGEEDQAQIALMHPGVGLAMAELLAVVERTVDDEGAAFVDHALAVARQLLGTTSEGAVERLAQSGVPTPGCDCGHDGMGPAWHLKACAWLAPAAPPAPADRAAVLREVAEDLRRLAEATFQPYYRSAYHSAADHYERLAGEAAAEAHHPTEPPTHLPKGTNAEDCPACAGANPPYPFLCPGPPAVPAAPEETQ